MIGIDLAFPFELDEARGRTALATPESHLRDLIEQVLFTNPGERVNRPDFGVGLMRAVFMPEGDPALATLRALVQGNLQRWLSHVITISGVDLETADATLLVTVRYVVLDTGHRRVERYAR